MVISSMGLVLLLVELEEEPKVLLLPIFLFPSAQPVSMEVVLIIVILEFEEWPPSGTTSRDFWLKFEPQFVL